MKRRAEATDVFGRIAALLHAGTPGALATVVSVEGSAYRRPGARMLVAADAQPVGGVSAGCLEEDVRLHAEAALDDGEIRLLRYDTSAHDSLGLGLGCDGVIEILVRPFQPSEGAAVARLAAALQGDGRIGLALALDNGALAAVADDLGSLALLGATPPLSAARAALGGRATAGAFAEALDPLPSLLVCGAGDDALPLIALAASVGFRVTVADHRPAALAPDRFPAGVGAVRVPPEGMNAEALAAPGGFAVVKTHSFERDREWLAGLLRTETAYIGLMGPRSRIARLRDEAGGDPRIFGPTGLDLGAAGAEQIAVSIVAELLAVRSGRSGAPLRERESSIHAAV